MKKNILKIALLLFSSFAFSQENSIENIEKNIKQIIENNTFTPETSNGVITNEIGKEIPFNISYYYHLESEKLFSVIYQEHDEISLSKTFYFENEKVVLAIIEKINNKVSKDRIVEQILYYFNNSELINTTELNENYLPSDLYKESMKYLEDFNNY